MHQHIILEVPGKVKPVKGHNMTKGAEIRILHKFIDQCIPMAWDAKGPDNTPWPVIFDWSVLYFSQLMIYLKQQEMVHKTGYNLLNLNIYLPIYTTFEAFYMFNLGGVIWLFGQFMIVLLFGHLVQVDFGTCQNG